MLSQHASDPLIFSPHVFSPTNNNHFHKISFYHLNQFFHPPRNLYRRRRHQPPSYQLTPPTSQLTSQTPPFSSSISAHMPLIPPPVFTEPSPLAYQVLSSSALSLVSPNSFKCSLPHRRVQDSQHGQPQTIYWYMTLILSSFQTPVILLVCSENFAQRVSQANSPG